MVGRGLNILLVLFNITFAVMGLYFIFKGGVVTPQSTALEYKDRGFGLGDDEGVSNGTFPPPIQLGPRAVGWLEHEIDEWIASRPRARLVPVVTPGPKGNFDGAH